VRQHRHDIAYAVLDHQDRLRIVIPGFAEPFTFTRSRNHSYWFKHDTSFSLSGTIREYLVGYFSIVPNTQSVLLPHRTKIAQQHIDMDHP
jgi:acyl-CoA thioesterase